MKILCLGGAGRISRETALDVVENTDAERVTIADCNEAAAREVVDWLNDPRVDFAKVDVHDIAATVATMRAYDLVLDGTTISLNGSTTACMAESGVHGVNLNGFGEEYRYDEAFRAAGKLCVPGFGMTPGVTNMMAKHAADTLESVDSVRVSHGAFRPIAFSSAIAETTIYEYDPDLPSRVVYEDGEFVQVPPFARPRMVELPEPFGTHEQYIIPHAETRTLAEYLRDKGVKLIEVRGTWPPKNMQLVRALYDWGFLRNDPVDLGSAEVGIMDAIAAYLLHAPEGRETELYGYALHVEVIGSREGERVRHIMTHTHPASDGSEPGWEKLRAYTRCVGIPMGVAAELIMAGRATGRGVLIPEKVFNPPDVFDALARRGIEIHETVESLEAEGGGQ